MRFAPSIVLAAVVWLSAMDARATGGFRGTEARAGRWGTRIKAGMQDPGFRRALGQMKERTNQIAKGLGLTVWTGAWAYGLAHDTASVQALQAQLSSLPLLETVQLASLAASAYVVHPVARFLTRRLAGEELVEAAEREPLRSFRSELFKQAVVRPLKLRAGKLLGTERRP